MLYTSSFVHDVMFSHNRPSTDIYHRGWPGALLNCAIRAKSGIVDCLVSWRDASCYRKCSVIWPSVRCCVAERVDGREPSSAGQHCIAAVTRSCRVIASCSWWTNARSRPLFVSFYLVL